MEQKTQDAAAQGAAQGAILPSQLSAELLNHLQDAVVQAGGWLGFDRFMEIALYTPGLGYYANGSRKFGRLPGSGSDFVTAPEMTPLFGQALAAQVAEALRATGTREIWEFGAGSGALALQLLETLDALGVKVERYTIVDLSAELRERQRQTLHAHAARVAWVDQLPAEMRGVVVGNEVFDAMPVQLLARLNGVWHERGVAWHEGRPWFADRPSALRPPVEIDGKHDYVTEIHPQAQAFVRTLAERLRQGAAFFLDYGFPESEYYHPQRAMGTVMCHRGHLADGDPLIDLGLKDITAHVDFTGLALAAQDGGLQLLGYTSQGRFLLNCGLLSKIEQEALAERAQAARLVNEHEMGELFKAIGWCVGEPWAALGFLEGDRSHRL